MRYSKARIIALTLFWSPVAYITFVVFGSIMVELYTHKPQHSTNSWCIGRLIGLKTELDRHLHIALTNTQTIEKDWLQRFAEAQQLCVKQSQAYNQLFSVYQGYTRALGALHHTQDNELSALKNSLDKLER